MPPQGEPPAADRRSNPWESAGAELARRQSSNRATPTAAVPAAVPPSASTAPTWTPQDERSGAVFLRRLGRGLLWFVVVLMAVTGVRSWFFPPKAQTPKAEAPKAAPAYPDAEAQAVATRFARAYLGWDEAKKEERAALLASVLPANSDTDMGWDGNGRQDVLTVQPGAVTLGNDHQARVRVEVLIRTAAVEGAGDKDKKAPAAESPARWVGLDVPVVQTAGRVIVTGPPGLVGIPTSGPKAPEIPTTQTDTELTAQTQEAVAKFFKAYAGGDTEAVTAPGASVPPLPEGVIYQALASWSIDTGAGDDRVGTARVSWTLGGATVEQVYRVELTQVSSSDAQRWQVADVRGGTL
ncbi:conjugal transfer protein [Streptomyces sp. SL203]|nr:conjugal transfer protein [Streptomyces sp. SL203]MCY1649213.1 conjugal transfer protein [Streptomyces sp. SL203]